MLKLVRFRSQLSWNQNYVKWSRICYIYLGRNISFINNDDEIQIRISKVWNIFWSLKWMNLTFVRMSHRYSWFALWRMSSNALWYLDTCIRADRSRHMIDNTDMFLSKILSAWYSKKVIEKVKLNISNWTGRIYRLEDDRCNKLWTEWTPLDCTRKIGKQLKRWRD